MSTVSELEGAAPGFPAVAAETAARPPGDPPKDLLAQLIVQRVWLHVRRRKAWLDSLPKGMSTEDEHFFSDPDDPLREERWSAEGDGKIWQEPIAEIDSRLADAPGRPLQILAQTFGLSMPEMDLLQTCLAQQLDSALAPVFAYLQGQNQAGFVSGPLVKRLFRQASNTFWHPLANLGRWKFVQMRESAAGDWLPLVADVLFLLPWLEGRLAVDAILARAVRPAPAHAPLDSWPLAEARHVIERSAVHGAPVRLVVTGQPGSGRTTLAAAAARQLGIECIVVDTTAINDEDWADAFLRVQRFALLGRFGVIWTGARTSRPWPRLLDGAAVQIVACEPDCEAAMPGWSDCRLALPPPTIVEKYAVWRRACAQFDEWSDDDRAALTECHELTLGQIAAVGRMKPEGSGQAIMFARDLTRQNLGNLGHFLPCPFTWDDIILGEDLRAALQDLAYEARTRGAFWDRPEVQRLFPRGAGLTALLSGTPGTGKTMAAQVIAAELNLDLFRVDLARVVSKYIGETAKHLSEIFSRAARMSAILLFDEADALFTRRTQVKDAHDRYANADTSYLLQLLEEFRGLALLTTNKRGNIDPAFYRRLRYVYEFPKPGPADRFKIWQRLTRELFGDEVRATLAPTQQKLAEQMPISPAQIKATLLASTFIARRRGHGIQAGDLMRALEREMAKEGRGIDDGMRVQREHI